MAARIPSVQKDTQSAAGEARASGRRARKGAADASRLSRHRKPEALSVEDWQTGLRRQFGREQEFVLKPIGGAGSGEFSLYNPQSKSQYRVAIRGLTPGDNFCACMDFATNDLGTCKHIEFTLGRLLKRRGGKKALSAGLLPAYSEVYLRYSGARRLCFRAGTDCPPSLRRLGERNFAPVDMASADDLPEDIEQRIEAVMRLAERLGHEVRFYDDARRFVAVARDARKRGEALDQAYPRGARDKALLQLLKTRLYPYQAEGALFVARAGRALLGDEMGLGKTVQAIAAAELLSRHAGAQRVLIVCPASLKHQWQREIGRFTRRDARVIGGGRVARERHYAAAAEARTWAAIVGYETLSRDLDLIESWAPDIVIVDEAQRVKNWNTIAARALKRINSPHAIVLTGTPLENRLEELVSIVQFVDQHRLGPTWRLLHEHQQRDEVGRVIGYQRLERIGATLAPIMLRRRKADVLTQLPERVDNTVMVSMTPEQRRLHDENADIVARIVQRWRRSGYLSDADQLRLTCALQNMRMSCNSTYLLDPTSDHGCKVDELVDLLAQTLAVEGAKVVIFSQWVRTHELIERRLREHGWGHVLFHGGVPVEQRPALIDRFHQDPKCRVFLSTDAGGVGLNLQHAAAMVINMDLPWNPAVLEQRIGRVHRMGQRQRVQVVNFVAEGSIEEGMLQVLSFKRSLFAGVLDGGPSEVFLEGTRLSRFMDSVDRVTQAARAIAPESDGEAAPGTDVQALPPTVVTDGRVDGVDGEDRGALSFASGSEAVATLDGGQQDPSGVGAVVEVAHDNALAGASKEAGAGSQENARDEMAGERRVDASAEASVAAPEPLETARATSDAGDAWRVLAEAGLALLAQLGSGGQGASTSASDAGVRPAIRIEREAATGRERLSLPLPEPAVLQRAAQALSALAALAASSARRGS